MVGSRRPLTPEAEATLAKLKSIRERRAALLKELRDVDEERQKHVQGMYALYPLGDAPTGLMAEALDVTPRAVQQIRDGDWGSRRRRETGDE